MARPKKDESLRKGKQISIRFSESDYARIASAAKKQNTTVTDYLRDRSVHRTVEITFQIIADPEEVKKAARELSGILINLQQISEKLQHRRDVLTGHAGSDPRSHGCSADHAGCAKKTGR